MKSQVIEVDFKRIKRHAKENRWTGLNIARHTGVSPSAVCNVLKGRTEPAATTLKKICDTIGLPIEEAFTTPKRRAA